MVILVDHHRGVFSCEKRSRQFRCREIGRPDLFFGQSAQLILILIAEDADRESGVLSLAFQFFHDLLRSLRAEARRERVITQIPRKPDAAFHCDILIDQDYRDVYEYHQTNNNDITIVTAVKSFKIPYGVIETGADGLMTALKEKPEQTYMINTGVYIINPNLIDEIPEGKFFHITDLMEKTVSKGGRVGCFPVSENAWKDMGEWNDYLKMINVR